jgi:hypothetical protein
MARRRQEIALQTEIETQEEWNETVNKEGLTGDRSYLILNFQKKMIISFISYKYMYLSQWLTFINNGQVHVKVLKEISNESKMKLENNY